MKIDVYLRDENKKKKISIKPFLYKELPRKVLNEWQSLVNYLTKSIDCSISVINLVTETQIKEFIRSNNKRYPTRIYQNNQLLNGTYCETVIGQDKSLLIKNSIDDSFQTLYKSVSYYGIPIKYSSGEYFGTLSILGNKELILKKDDIEIINMVRDSIEKDLQILLMKKEVKKLSILDPVTGLYNKYKINNIIFDYQEELNRNISKLSIAQVVISNYKDIQIEKGEQAAEEMLTLLARIMKNRARYVDRLGRVDINEFIILSKGSTSIGQEVLLKDLKRYTQTHLQLEEYNIQFDYKITEILYGENINQKIGNAS